ncbi:uncharacterized protein LOC115881899 [Sitophilus oryzae]|uniref:Uncharacterized protein LOC115881899 n=1 Tax=Sitophilus oryzae TaxID=7048 RepID=A0A6J2XVC1_SITOR|nr:uncharacterized protein LOC115881899 [Sitophilus oryzae]
MNPNNLQTLKKKRGNIKGQITRFENFINNFNDEYDQLKVRMAQCQRLWQEFDEVQMQIEMHEDVNGEDTNVDERAEFEDKYYQVIANANGILELNLTNSNSAQSIQQVVPHHIPGIKFPKIDLPTFTGNYLLYGNHIAWKLLKDRYHNKRLIIHNHVKAIFELPQLSRESHVSMRQLLDNFNKNLRALESLQEPVDKWDTLLIYLICSKLDNSTRREWEVVSEPLTIPSTKDFTDFLHKRCILLQTINYKKPENKSQSPSNISSFKNTKSFNHKEQSQNYFAMAACVICKQTHKITICDKFLSLSPKTRYAEAKKHKLCANCLGAGHSYQTCTTENLCMVCNKKHHVLLHFENNKSTDNPVQEKSVSAHTTFKNDEILLSTAIVFMCDSSGRYHQCKVLLDSGSQSNFITKELCEKLNLSKQTLNLAVSGLSKASLDISHKVQATIKSVHNNFQTDLSFLIPENIKLADPSCNVPSKIDALLGASIFWSLLCIGQIKLTNSQIISQKIKLGWILSGQANISVNIPSKTVCHFSINSELQKQLENFWRIEHVESSPVWSLEQKACENDFVLNHKREENGRFSVQLPLKIDSSKLGESKSMALKRFKSLEKRLRSNTELHAQYADFLDEYQTLGHMSEVHTEDPTLNYLPHTCVFRESSSTTKVRVVFDASAKTESGLSLNDALMTGPTIQQDLFSIILRFRKHQYVITADCAKMYRQVNVHDNQRHLQSILWRKNADEPLKAYTLNTVTYGTSCAPFLAVRCLHQLALENQKRNPKISNVIKEDFYVDDLISGGDTIEDVLQIKKDITGILSQGLFELRKWKSNEASIIEPNMPENNQLYFSENKETKTLGIVWNSEDDTFQYSLHAICDRKKYVTKRTILSFISKIFDPLGLIGPIIIRAKILIQQLWQLSLDWDESVPSQIYTAWKYYQDQIISRKIFQYLAM